MTDKQILDYVKAHPAGKVKLAITDIDGVMRGKYISTEKFWGIVDGHLGAKYPGKMTCHFLWQIL
jgi:glutamine synthetase